MKRREVIQGFFVDLLSCEEVIDKILDRINANLNTHVVTINPEIIQNAKKMPNLAKIINEAEIVTPDGVGIKIALKFKGIDQEQVTGVDLAKKMIEKCALNNIKLGLVGAKPEVLELVIKNLKNDYPNLNIAFSHDGYFDDFYPVIQGIINSDVKFILCAMGSPKQEIFISELKKQITGACMIGVGGTFDVLSGCVKLAPQIYRKLGLEWLYRTVKQPERFKRIFPTLPIFFFQSIIDSIKSKRNS